MNIKKNIIKLSILACSLLPIGFYQNLNNTSAMENNLQNNFLTTTDKTSKTEKSTCIYKKSKSNLFSNEKNLKENNLFNIDSNNKQKNNLRDINLDNKNECSYDINSNSEQKNNLRDINLDNKNECSYDINSDSEQKNNLRDINLDNKNEYLYDINSDSEQENNLRSIGLDNEKKYLPVIDVNSKQKDNLFNVDSEDEKDNNLLVDLLSTKSDHKKEEDSLRARNSNFGIYTDHEEKEDKLYKNDIIMNHDNDFIPLQFEGKPYLTIGNQYKGNFGDLIKNKNLQQNNIQNQETTIHESNRIFDSMKKYKKENLDGNNLLNINYINSNQITSNISYNENLNQSSKKCSLPLNSNQNTQNTQKATNNARTIYDLIKKSEEKNSNRNNLLNVDSNHEKEENLDESDVILNLDGKSISSGKFSHTSFQDNSNTFKKPIEKLSLLPDNCECTKSITNTPQNIQNKKNHNTDNYKLIFDFIHKNNKKEHISATNLDHKQKKELFSNISSDNKKKYLSATNLDSKQKKELFSNISSEKEFFMNNTKNGNLLICSDHEDDTDSDHRE